MGQQRDLVGCLDLSRRQEDLLPIDQCHALFGERREHRHLDDVDADWLILETELGQDFFDLLGDRAGSVGAGRNGTAQRRDTGARTFVGHIGTVGPDLHAGQPRVVELMVSRGRAEVPHDGLATARQQRKTDQLVHGPRADVGPGHVANIVEVER